mmetsp:Transcript_17799/g.15709  ORF Transcript_17799/g.15709 Transcript_17799/m.15709 type:complete len:91 (+) Transcript_17799:226-498(+)
MFDDDFKCDEKSPLCLYDFTNRSTIIHFLVYQISKPAVIIEDYFGTDDEPDTDHFLRNLVNCESSSSALTISDVNDENGENLLMGRKMHL